MTNENDENAGTTRMTRGKAALGGADDLSDLPKKALQSKKSTNALGTNGAKKRAALGDVSNVTKTEGLGAGAKGGKEDKKPLATKGGLVSKAAQPTGIKKPSRGNSTRSALVPKDRNAPPKRPASGSGIAGHATKKRTTADRSSKSVKEEEEPEESENVPPAHHNTAPVEAEPTKSNGAKHERAQSQLHIDEVEEPLAEGEVPDDLDKEDADDPLMVSEYVVEIFEYLKQLEITTMANPDYMDNQTELEWKMRGILVDWLLEVHTRFRLLPETLFLAVNIIDRFLSAKVVQLDRLQLVGVTAMFIASKYEEVLSPHVQNFRHVADDGFTEEEILSAERFVLAALNYDLSYPNPMNFLRRISKADNYDIQTRTLGKYLLEIGCLDHRFLAYPPSQVAAAAMYLARLVLERGEWVCPILSF